MTSKSRKHFPAIHIDALISTVRGERVILDTDLAAIYGVPTFRFNEAVKRNRHRFPEDFRFQLTQEEWKTIQALRSQNAILNSGRGKHRKYLPHAFTEHGAVMAANILNSQRAVQMSIFVVRAFIKMRETFATNKALMEKLNELEKKLTGRLDTHERAIVYVLEEIKKLMQPPILPEPKRRPIGFGKGEE
ncbi:MAG: ORF6N domain-containing protein [Ignavibacteriae bacterium]|nr:ORF6N domain-containing protein [Ignavibacteria bacterium]MBI3364212.1 ORF6N domain-containing protein [Ignavibacteriota bacterium]